MFETDYRIHGCHADYIIRLVTDLGIFERYIDVMMNAAVWGLLYGRRSERDNSSSRRANILTEQLARERKNLVFLFRLVMLLDQSSDLSSEDRINRAFRESAEDDEEKMRRNMKVFHSYVLGGLEVLHESHTVGCITHDDYIARIDEIVAEFARETEGKSVGVGTVLAKINGSFDDHESVL